MILSLLRLVAGSAFAEVPPKSADEDVLRVMLLKLHHNQDWEVRQAIFGAGDALRDAVTAGSAADRKRLANRLPGMASKDPLDICRDLFDCPEAPLALHVADNALVDDAILALARPWFKLQKARGKAVFVDVDPGTGVRLRLEDLPNGPVVTLEAGPAPTGGFDVSVTAKPEALKAYATERAAILQKEG